MRPTCQANTVIDARAAGDPCRDCPARYRCLVHNALKDGAPGLRPCQQHLRAGEHLYWRDDPFDALFLVVSGALKAYNVDIDGNERVRGFHFPSALLGFDGIGQGCHRCHSVALESTVVCRLPFDRLLGVARHATPLQASLFRRLSQHLVHAETLAGDYSAAERVAHFILEIAANTDHGDSLRLPMPRQDIANYLRLATETVSRIVTDFRQRGLIACRGRDLAILNADALRAIAEPTLSN